LITLLAGLCVSLVFFFEARQNARAAEDNLAKFDRLSVVVRMKKARLEARQLLPAWPDKVPAMQAWLTEYGTPMQQSLADLRASLARMRTAGIAEPRPDPALQDRIEKIRDAHGGFAKELERPLGNTPTALDVRQLVLSSEASTASELAALEAKQAKARLYRFADESEQFLHDALAELVDDLEQFVEEERGMTQFVQKNLQWASELWQRSIEDHRHEWDLAIEAIRKDPVYGGLELPPQVGLQPLWKNPQSGLWEFGHLRSGNAAWHLVDEQTGNLEIDNQMGIVFVLIPGGSFAMGSQLDDESATNYDSDSEAYERPVHRVTLDPFFLSKHELTQAQWIRLGGPWESGHKALTASGSNHELTLSNPAENVTCEAAQHRLREHGLDLPTEAQWEYACRAGTTTRWSFGDELRLLRRHGNIADQSAARYSRMQCENWNDTHTVHAPIGSFLPNPYGLFATYGHFAEGCRDQLAPYSAPVAKGDGLRDGKSLWRIARGGGFGRTARFTRSATRDRFRNDYKSADTGMRPARRLLGR
jgi:formylglycine-generating enzyme required for sulfatase activity